MNTYIHAIDTEESADARGERLYTAHYAQLYRYLYFRLHDKNETEDLVQTVFLKAIMSLKNGIWDGGGDIYYLFTIARNTLIDHFRRLKHTPIASDELIESIADRITTDGPVEERERHELIVNATQKLSEAECMAVNLRYLSDVSYAAIAEQMGKGEEAVRQLVHRGLRSLRKVMEE